MRHRIRRTVDDNVNFLYRLFIVLTSHDSHTIVTKMITHKTETIYEEFPSETENIASKRNKSQFHNKCQS